MTLTPLAWVDLQLIFFGVSDWDGMPQRSRQIARELAERFSVLYVDPCYYSFIGLIRDSLLGTSIRDNVYQVRHFAHGSHVLSLPPLFPKGLSFPSIAHLNYSILMPLLKRTIQDLEIESPVLWTSLPPDRALIGSLDERLVVYDCMDLHTAFRRGRAAARLAREERRLLSEVDLVIASSQELVAHCSKHNENVYLVRNGVNADRFRHNARNRANKDEPQSNDRFVVGYVGTLGEWVDLDILWEIATSMPDILLRIIGPVEVNLGRLTHLSNVKFLGEVPYDLVPSHVNEMDVCLLPFVVNELTRAVNPIKLYEYFSLGKPVVSTDLPEVLVHKDMLYIADGGVGFVDAVRQALKEEDPELVRRRKAVADENSWRKRADQILDILSNHL